MRGGIKALITSAPIMDKYGGIIGAIQTVQEIKDYAEASGEESYLIPTFKIDPQGRITLWNRACEQDFGFSSSHMIGKSVLSIIVK